MGRFLGWQICLMGSELDEEVLQQGSKTHCRYLEWVQQRKVMHLLSGMPTQLLASFHQQCPSSPYGKTKYPKHAQADKYPDFGILWREYNCRAFNRNYLRVESAAPRPARGAGDLKLCSTQSSVTAKPEGLCSHWGFSGCTDFLFLWWQLHHCTDRHMGETGKLEEQSRARVWVSWSSRKRSEKGITAPCEGGTQHLLFPIPFLAYP